MDGPKKHFSVPHMLAYSEKVKAYIKKLGLRILKQENKRLEKILKNETQEKEILKRENNRLQESLKKLLGSPISEVKKNNTRQVKEETGIRTVFHHHCSTWIEAPWEISRLLELTDPELIGLCFDTGHYRFGGGDPVEGLKQHASRIRHVHFKDCDAETAAAARREKMEYNEAVGRGLFCELGRGEVDFRGILHELEAIGYDGWVVVEQDVLPNMGTPKQMAMRNREFLRSIGL